MKDFTSGSEPIKICNNALYIGPIKVISKNEYPDLFEFTLSEDSKPESVQQHVRVFGDDKNQYVSMVSKIDYMSWNKSAIGMYRKENNKFIQIFKKSFDDNPGRWVDIEFGEDYSSRDQFFFLNHQGEGMSISGDIGMLGCYGDCRLLWWDFYDWDPDKKTYVLANNKHPDNFKKLLENYEEMDKTTCLNQANISKSISELYPLRKDKEKLCSDVAEVPFTSPKDAETLLKGIKALKMIISGENISMSQVKDISL